MVDKIIQKENNIKMQVKNLNFYYEKNQVLKNINLIVKSNAVTAIIGPSGCGKSTFIRTLNRMNDIISGTKIEGDILFNHKNIYAEDIDVVEIRRKIHYSYCYSQYAAGCTCFGFDSFFNVGRIN